MKFNKYLKLGDELVTRKQIEDLEDGTVVYYCYRANAMYQASVRGREMAVKRKTVLQDVFGRLLTKIDNIYRNEGLEESVYIIKE